MGFIGALSSIIQNINIPLAEMPGLDAVVGNLMKWMNSWIFNIGWTVVLFTVLLKLVTFPLDFLSRRSMKIYSLKMEKIQPQLEKIKKQYANNKQLMQQKQMAIQRKMGASAFASCIPTIVTMVLFFYVFSAFNSYLNYQTVDNFNQMVTVYQQQIGTVESQTQGDGTVKEVYLPGEIKDIEVKYNDAGKLYLVLTDEQQKQLDAKLLEAFENTNPSFLWIKNVSFADVPWTGAIPLDPKAYLGQKASTSISSDVYNAVMGPVIKAYTGENGKMAVNGYLIMPILAVGISVLTTIITQKTQKAAMTATQGDTGKTVSKVMMFMMPLMYLMFSLMSSSAFTIYMTTNSLITLLTTLLINWIVEKTVKLKEKKQAPKGVGYRRDN